MKMYIDSEWTHSPESSTISSPYSGEVVDTVPVATPEQIERTLAAAEKASRVMAALSAYERNRLLNKAADILADPARQQDLAETISREEGKPLAEAGGEVSRIPDFLRLCAFEGAQLRGETLPVDAQAGAEGKFGYTIHVPCGVVVAITPFNYPVLLVAHKVGPALATGNAVILKPASQTPLSGLKLTMSLLEAGFPENAIQCITGSGDVMGRQLCSDPRVRKISFTGSSEVGERITRVAGVKKLSMELGSNAPLIVLDDADLEQVAKATAIGGFVNAGQVCISTQRVLVDKKVYVDFLDALKGPVEAIRPGDPLAEGTTLGPMISENEAQRVGDWITEAVDAGARVVTGGHRNGTMFSPTIVADVDPEMRIARDELFGPAVAVTPVKDVDEAIAQCNNSVYGLGAGIFTSHIGNAIKFAHHVQSGNVMINWTPLWRADLMPYGGLKNSGFGKEGPRYAVREMTDLKTIVIHGLEQPGEQ